MKVSNDKTNAAIQSLTTGNTTGPNKKGKVDGKNAKETSSLEARNNSAQVNLSDRAQEMKKLKELAMQAPDVNMDKVKKFQELIDGGKYKVDSKKVADKMVDDELMHASSEES